MSSTSNPSTPSGIKIGKFFRASTSSLKAVGFILREATAFVQATTVGTERRTEMLNAETEKIEAELAAAEAVHRIHCDHERAYNDLFNGLFGATPRPGQYRRGAFIDTGAGPEFHENYPGKRPPFRGNGYGLFGG